METTNKKKISYLSVDHKRYGSMIFHQNPQQRYTFNSKQEGIDVLKEIAKKYATKRKAEDEEVNGEELELWVSGFQLTDDEKSKNYIGNFCKIEIEAIEDHFVFKATKINKALKDHPKPIRYLSIDQAPYDNIIFNRQDNERYTFNTKQEGIEVLKEIAEKYVTERDTTDDKVNEEELVLWVSGFQLTDQEKCKRYKGNFCKIEIEPVEDCYAFRVSKVEAEIGEHPTKKTFLSSNIAPFDEKIFNIHAKKQDKHIFSTKEEGVDLLKEIAEKYAIDWIKEDGEELVLWVRSYLTSNQEIQDGFQGSFCKIKIEPVNEGFVSKVIKIDRKLEDHPMRLKRYLSMDLKVDTQKIFPRKFLFDYKGLAISFLEKVAKVFETVKVKADGKELELWVADFQVSNEEKKLGYKGNYCKVEIEEVNGRFAFKTSKIKKELKDHPKLPGKFLSAHQNSSIDKKIFGTRYLFESKQDAVNFINDLAGKYKIKKKISEEELELWVRHFELTDEEIRAGFKGNFCNIEIEEVNNYFALKTRKIKVKLKDHPDKNANHAMPNWGHPILRGIKRRRVYFEKSEARSELNRLYDEFPDTSVAGDRVFRFMIFSRKDDPKNPVKKYLFEIFERPDGTWGIDYRINPNQGNEGRYKVPEFSFSTFW